MLTAEGLEFVTERHLATLSSHARDGSIHAVPVGFTYADGIARVITSGTSQKVLNLRRSPHATISQVDGAHWLSLIGTASVHDDPETVADAVDRYAQRYRVPRENPARVAIIITVEHLLGTAAFRMAQ